MKMNAEVCVSGVRVCVCGGLLRVAVAEGAWVGWGDDGPFFSGIARARCQYAAVARCRLLIGGGWQSLLTRFCAST